MVDMTITEMEKKEMAAPSIIDSTPKYPHGLCLSLNAEVVKKLGLSDAPEVTEKFIVKAIAEVTEVRVKPTKGDERDFCLELQITDLELMKNEKKEERSFKGFAEGRSK